jgi:hypothetical protein
MTDSEALQSPEIDPEFQSAIHRLHTLTVWGRWAVALGLWVTVGAWSLWGLRGMIGRLRDVFTWSAVRYGLFNNPGPAIALGLCVGMTVSVLVWQSRNILWGLPVGERDRLHQRLLQIKSQGPSHPLWRWIFGNENNID